MPRPRHKLGRFVGRSAEIVAVRDAVREHGLVTLVGPGGCGKTRLAIEVAGDVPRFEDGIVVVELAEVGDAAALAQVVARAAGVRADATAALVDALTERAVLVVLDNCEHLAAACATLAAAVVERCPRAGVLATSREPLGVPGEVVWHVPPLSLPRAGEPADTVCDAVALFVDRARAASRAFALTGANAPHVARICRRLDGIPLAIELAAARVRVMSAAELADHLDGDAELLALSQRATTSRHHTLRAAIDWSWRGLPDDERALLARMAVFAGEVEASSVEAVCGAGREMLWSLVERSLVEVSGGEPARYRLLEMIRQYAADKLNELGSGGELRARHAEHVVTRCERLHPYERGSHPGDIEAELSNARAALQFLIGEPDASRVARAAGLIDALMLHWMRLGTFAEGRRSAEAIVEAARGAGIAAPAPALRAAGVFAWLAGDLTAATARLAGAIERGDLLARSFASQVALSERRLDDAIRGAREADAAAADQPAFVRAMTATNLGNALRAGGQLDEAERAYRESLELAERVANGWGRAMALRNLASVDSLRGDHARAEARLVASLRACREIGDVWFASRGVEALAEVAVARGQHERAAQLLGAGAALREAIGVAVLAMYRAGYEATEAAAQASLGAGGFATAHTRGRAMSLDDVIAELDGRATPAPSLRITALGRTAVTHPRGADSAPDTAHGKPLDVLVFLLCNGPSSREQIGAALWPDAPPAQLRNSLNVAVHRLRRALGDKARIVHDAGVYSFNRSLPHSFDVDDFEAALARARAASDAPARLAALEDAIALYTGDLLADRPSAEWMIARADALAAAYSDALVDAGALCIGIGEPRRAARHLRAAVAADPYAEHAHRGLALALARAGDRAGALAQLDALRDLLARELDVEPAPATRALADRIRAGGPLENIDFIAD